MRIGIYYWLKIAAFLLLFLLMIAVQSVILRLPLISWLSTDILLICILYFAIKKNIIEGMSLSFILSYFAELSSLAPSGLILSCYMITYILTNVAKDFIQLQKSESLFPSLFFVCVTWKLSFLIIAAFIGNMEGTLQKTILVFPFYLMAQLLLTKPLFYIFHRIDSLSEKNNLDRYIST